MVVQPENNDVGEIIYVRCFDSLVFYNIYSTFGVLAGVDSADLAGSSAFGAGPVCVIGTTRSVFGGAIGLRGAVIVKIPSDDNDD